MIETPPDVEALATRIAEDPAAFDGALDAVGPERIPQPIREAAAASLKLMARSDPAVLLPHWDRIVALLSAPNAYSQMIASHLIGILAPAAGESRMAVAVPAVTALFGGQVSVAGHALMVCGEIGASCPETRAAITAAILGLDAVAIPDRLGLLRSYAIEALAAYLPAADRTPQVIEFVSRGLGEGAKTRKVARDVLAAWDAER